MIQGNGEDKAPIPLFRPEVSSARGDDWLGQVILLRPLSFRFLTLFAIVSATSLILFAVFAKYTKHAQVNGMLMPDAGLIKVQSPLPGIIVERRIQEGQQVKAGDVLFVLSTELVSAENGTDVKTVETGTAAVEMLIARQDSLRSEVEQERDISNRQAEQLRQNISGLQAEVHQLDQEISTQQTRLKAAQAQYERHQELARQNYISSLALQQKQDEMLDQQGRLQAMQRTRLGLFRNIDEAQNDLAALPSKSQREKAQLDRQILELRQQTLSGEAHHKFYVTAPQSGTVTAILSDPGQAVSTQTLLTILPANAKLEAQLYVPSQAVGFIEAGQDVRIRFSAYPYQKFGQYEGVIQDVSRTSLGRSDVPEQMANIADAGGLYRIRVHLNSQNVSIYGNLQPLTAGMLLNADIIQERRSIIEWLFEPLYSLRGKV